jgi:hypothetical protein
MLRFVTFEYSSSAMFVHIRSTILVKSRPESFNSNQARNSAYSKDMFLMERRKLSFVHSFFMRIANAAGKGIQQQHGVT